jgi:hypothetical protein
MKKFIVVLLLITVNAQFSLAQKDPDINAKIRKYATMENSKIMNTLHYLTDVYGPRLTGSPNHKAAAEWAAKEMLAWGFDKSWLEPWDFGHPGWVNERASGFITAPVKDNLTFETLAWTPSTVGVARGLAYNLVLPDRPTQEELEAFFAEVRPAVRGKIVLVGKSAVVPVNFNPQAKRISDEDLKRRLTPGAPQGPPPFAQPPAAAPKPNALPFLKIAEQLDAFLLKSGALVRVNDAGREHGQIRAFNNRSFDVRKTVPTVILRNEDYGRVARLLAGGQNVSLEFNIRNRVIPKGATSYNVIGEITGTDKKDEVVMLGGHLDSWHAATGATDNAIGCAIMMDAARILKAMGVKPRRTIRVALWSGEEQGLLGSQAYVKKHYGSFENPTAEYEKFNGYFNIDSGTGRARGMSVFGPPEGAAILNSALASFADLGFGGVLASTSRGLGGTDHTSFNNGGLPGIGVFQDPIEYGSHTWHTNLDTYERIVEEDVRNASIVIAAGLYELAMRDDMLPRFKADMPKPPPTPAPTPSPTPAPKKTKGKVG